MPVIWQKMTAKTGKQSIVSRAFFVQSNLQKHTCSLKRIIQIKGDLFNFFPFSLQFYLNETTFNTGYNQFFNFNLLCFTWRYFTKVQLHLKIKKDAGLSILTGKVWIFAGFTSSDLCRMDFDLCWVGFLRLCGRGLKSDKSKYII